MLTAIRSQANAGLKGEYEKPLDEFTSCAFRRACQILGRLPLEHPYDGPSLLLLARAVSGLLEKPDPLDAVMAKPWK